MGAFDPYSLGPWLIGVVINVLLYGVMLMQTFQYYLVCEKDFRWVKWMVGVLFVVETVNTGLNVADLYRYCVTLFGQFEEVAKTYWIGNTTPAFTSTISAIVQLFYAYRILRLTKNRWITGFVVVTALTQCAAGMAATINFFTIHSVSDQIKVKNEILVWQICSIVTDVVITCTLVVFLRSARTGFHNTTDDVISKIIRITVQTCLLTTLWAGTFLALYMIRGDDLNFIFSFSLCKLYTNTLLSSLNARPLRNPRTTTESRTGTTVPTARFGYPDTSRRATERSSVFARHTVNTIDITVHRSTDINPDDLNELSASTTSLKKKVSTGSTADDVQEIYVGDQKVTWSNAV